MAVHRASPWVALVIVGREFTILGLRAAVESGGRRFETSMLGKWKATVQFVAIALAILRPDVMIAGAYLDQWAMVIAAIVTAWSGVDYIVRSPPRCAPDRVSRVFVTGGTGVIGTALVTALLERGDEVVGARPLGRGGAKR